MSGPEQRLFRREALEHHARPEVQGSLLRLVPLWTHVAYWVVAAVCGVAAVGLALVDVHEYARGTTLVRIKGLEEVTATAGGRVARVLVQRGERVRAGQPLVELYAGGERAEQAQASQVFRAQLASWLLEPTTPGARPSMAGLRAQVELSEARREERVLKAPCDGRVSEVRVREHQFLAPGEVVASLAREGAEAWAVAVLPGQYRPLLRPGQPMRLQLTGFPEVFQSLTVASVSNELLGPAEVQRQLGPGLRDALAVQGPLVLVEARLPGDTFHSGESAYAYYPGMPGQAWVRVRSRNGWVSLLPVLELLRRGHD